MNGRLVLIRHGLTACTVADQFCGAHDPQLSDVGWQMAQRVARHPKLEGIDTLISSPSVRARGTAEAIARTRDLPVAVDDRLRELEFGEWETLVPSGVRDQLALRRWERDPAFWAPPGGESALTVMARAVAATRDALQGARDVAIVSHKAPIRLILAFFLGVPPSRYREIRAISVGSVSQLRLTDGQAIVDAIGDTSHLPGPWQADPDHAEPLTEPIRPWSSSVLTHPALMAMETR